jgi:hypothetical protein
MVIDWQVGGELEVGQGTPARQTEGSRYWIFSFSAFVATSCAPSNHGRMRPPTRAVFIGAAWLMPAGRDTLTGPTFMSAIEKSQQNMHHPYFNVLVHRHRTLFIRPHF